ncbi:MAG: molybdopterin-dependent oxidoreductase [Pseudomonadota bacterium]
MTDKLLLSRRKLIGGLGVGAGGLILSGCDALGANEGFRSVLRSGEDLTYRAQRLVSDRNALAKEFEEADMSPLFRANGNIMPASTDYAAHLATNFADWRLVVDGLVARPLSVPLAALMAMPQRSQITRHDCVEGWSAIGKWQGPNLSHILSLARLLPSARYIVFHCADSFGSHPYYESIDLVDALHPQSILAWRMNDAALPVAHGAPIRLRVERQLGYKQAKYVMRIEARERIDTLYRGKGGFWEDDVGYQWYAGI